MVCLVLSDCCLSVCCLSVCNIGVLSPNGWMDEDETWHAGRPRPRPHCVRWDLAPPERGTAAPAFGPMSIVAKRSPISATAEHLLILEIHISWLSFICFVGHFPDDP